MTERMTTKEARRLIRTLRQDWTVAICLDGNHCATERDALSALRRRGVHEFKAVRATTGRTADCRTIQIVPTTERAQ